MRVRKDELVFTPGTEKQFIYWIDDGHIELHWSMQGGGADHIETLGPGEYFGLGFLKHHACAALAVEDTRLNRLPRATSSLLSETDPNFRRRDAVDNQREFKHRREMMVACAAQPLSQRLASFLGVIARFNEYEGRDPTTVNEDIRGLVVAEYLATDMDGLGKALRQLSNLGAIELVPPHGLRIRDLNFLEYIANTPSATRLD